MAPVTPKHDAIVIGAGHNGLVTAAYLAQSGLRTLVLERRDAVGGAAVTETFYPGFKVDSGAHRIAGFHPGVSADLELLEHGFEAVRTDPAVLAPLPDRPPLVLWRDPKKTSDAMRAFSDTDAENWVPFGRRVSTIAAFLSHLYDTTPAVVPEVKGSDLWRLLKLGRRLRGLGKQEMFEVLRTLPMSVAEFADDWFQSDIVKGVLGAAGITGIFQGPMAAGTAWVMLHHHVWNGPGAPRATSLVRGGIGTLGTALAAAARQRGVEVRTGVAVQQVVVSEGRATGVVLQTGEEIACRIVVSNADPRRTFSGLIDATHLEPRFLRDIRNIKFRGALAKVHLALGELPAFRGVADQSHLAGAISISPSLEYLERAYDDAKYGSVSRRPYLEAVIPTITDPTFAPPGKHVMSVYVQYAPYHLADGTWDDMRRERLGDAVVDTLAEYAPNIPNAIIHRQVLSPRDLETTFGLSEGNIYHGELTLDQLFFMRPAPGWARYRTPISQLYLCGAGTHPGGGVNGASGYHAAQAVLHDVKQGGKR
jgi:phytoene dehydrogenase-like protein